MAGLRERKGRERAVPCNSFDSEVSLGSGSLPNIRPQETSGFHLSYELNAGTRPRSGSNP